MGPHAFAFWNYSLKPYWKVETRLVDHVAMVLVVLVHLRLLDHLRHG